MTRSKIRELKTKTCQPLYDGEIPPRSKIRERKRKRRKQTALRMLVKALMISTGVGLIGYTAFTRGHSEYHQYLLREVYRDYFYEIPAVDSVITPVTIIEELPMRLVIPKINVDLIVLYGDVFNRTLQNRGPVFFQMSDLPSSERGNVAIAGHRGSFWGFFTDLDRLQAGDEIYIDTGGYRFIYHVEWTVIVEPGDWSAIETTDYPALTLQTCEPKNRRATHRLIVRSALEKVTVSPEPVK